MAPYRYKVIDLDITSGLTNLEYELAGTKIVYLDGTNPITVKIEEISNDSIILNPKDQISMPFTKFYVSSAADTDPIQIMVIKPTDIDLRSNMINVDKIQEVVKISRDLPRFSASYLGYTYSLNAVVYPGVTGTYTTLHLWNSSTYKVVIDDLVVNHECFYGFHSPVVGTLLRSSVNKNDSYSDSLIDVYSDNTATTQAITESTAMGDIYEENLQAFLDPIILSPSNGLLLVSFAIDTNLAIRRLQYRKLVL